jgi:inner membrane protein involved in colicin E2 resistance
LFLVSVDSDDSSGDEELLNRPLASILFKSQNNEKNGKHKRQTWSKSSHWHQFYSNPKIMKKMVSNKSEQKKIDIYANEIL